MHSTFALVGPGSAAMLRAAGLDVPDATWSSAVSGSTRISRMPAAPDAGERFLLTTAGESGAVLDSLPATRRTSAIWWWSEVAAGVPTVFAVTQEKFVPQMINFEVIGGVSFSKGCYPGQEVVARSQYRGRVKRRMQLAHCTAYAPAGADVFAVGEVEPAGTVVMSATAPKGGFDLLFEISLDKAELPLRLASPDGEALQQRALPYDLVDVTA
jgi:folate-binding protein YgfZ